MSLRTWLHEKIYSRGDGLTCEERMLKLMGDHDWWSTDMLRKHMRDPITIKGRLKKKGHLFERKYEGRASKIQKKGTQFETFYRLVGRIPCLPSSKGKRGYLEDFGTEELVSELWARGSLNTMLLDGNIYHVISHYDDSKLTHPCLHNHTDGVKVDKKKI